MDLNFFFLQISSLLTNKFNSVYITTTVTVEPFPTNTPWSAKIPVYRKAYRLPKSQQYLNHSIQTLVCCFHKIICHFGGFQRPGILLALSLIVLASLNIARQWRGPKNVPSSCSTAQEHITTSIPDTQWCPNSIRFREEFHSTSTEGWTHTQ